MARKRMIDPSFWVDEKLGSLPPVVRLLFMGLISQADDDGRLNGHPSLVKSLIFPYDHDMQALDVDEWLALLAADERKVIVRYEVDHQKYILITNFKKHQTINKPQKSKLPEPLPDNYGSDTVVVHDDSVPIEEEEKLIESSLREEEEKDASADPYIHLITEFCTLHDKLDIHLKTNEREDAHKLLNMGIPIDYIVTTIKKIYKQRTDKGEKITSLSYYTNAIIEAWKGELEYESHKGLRPDGNAGKDQGTPEIVGWLPSKYNTNDKVIHLPKVSG